MIEVIVRHSVRRVMAIAWHIDDIVLGSSGAGDLTVAFNYGRRIWI